MTEQEWNECTRPLALVEYVLNTTRPSNRKLILLACAVYNSAGGDLPLSYQEAIANCELNADLPEQEQLNLLPVSDFEGTIRLSTHTNGSHHDFVDSVVQAIRHGYRLSEYPIFQAVKDPCPEKRANVVRHVFCHPSKKLESSTPWSAPVIRLADALYQGEPCPFVLHDALLEAGHAELAEHFRTEQAHPKGCWVLDRILGKE